jgi:hypothetical protein
MHIEPNGPLQHFVNHRNMPLVKILQQFSY